MRELTRQETKQFQGLSILAMVLLHLFCTYNYEGKFTPLVMLQGVPLVFYPAQFGDFCVFAFAFCSGYGHMVQYEKIAPEQRIDLFDASVFGTVQLLENIEKREKAREWWGSK